MLIAIVAVGSRGTCALNCGYQEVTGRVLAAGGPNAGSGVAGIDVDIMWSWNSVTVTTDADGSFGTTMYDYGYSPLPGTYIFDVSPPTWIAFTMGDEQHLPAAAAGPFVPVPASGGTDARWRAQ